MPYIKEKADYDYMVDGILRNGYPRLSTYEIVGQTVKTSLSFDELIDVFSVPRDVVNDFFTALIAHEKVNIGPYDTSQYLFIESALRKAIIQFDLDSVLTRRCIVQFPIYHCFQSIQFLVNSNCLNVICQMRSCNAVDNLPMDMIIVASLGNKVVEHLKKRFGLCIQHQEIYMQIGSLHVFKKKDNKY